MTVAQWIRSRTPQPPEALLDRILGVIGEGGEQPAAQTPRVCVLAAARQLETLVAHQRYERESALDLLAVDALVTYAFEHASTSPGMELERLSQDALRQLGALAPTA